MKNKVNVSTRNRQGNQVYLQILKKENKMKRLVFLMCIFLSFSALYCADRSEIGTIENPYQIRTPAELNSVRNYLGAENNDKHFKLMNDIDLTAYLASGGAGFTAWGASGWLPIGDSGNRFFGKFDGNNKKITGLKINRPATDYVGLFGYINTGGEIKDLGVEIDPDGSVIGRDYVGGLAGAIFEGTIINCFTTGSVTGIKIVGGLVGYSGLSPITNSYTTGSVSGTGVNPFGGGGINVGGLVGRNWKSTITNSYATGSVSGTGDNIGGLVGYNVGESGSNTLYTITDSYATGSISATGPTSQNKDYVGGLVGRNLDASIINSYATGSVTANSWNEYGVGGLVGRIGSSIITNCYSTGSVIGVYSVGGLIGVGGGTISNSYTSGSVSGESEVGGLLGNRSSGTITNSFWNVDTDGIVGNVSGANNFGATGKTTAQMKDVATFTGWDFPTIWTLNSTDNNGYPALAWQGFSNGDPDFANGDGTEQDPYQITTPAELNSVRNYLGASNYFKLMNDIDLTAYLASGGEGFTAWGASGWRPIGDNLNNFLGKFDGNGKKITGLKISRTNIVGLFGYIGNGGKIENLGVEINGSVRGYDNIGGIVGSNSGIISNSYITGSVSGQNNVGGIVGSNNGTISNCYATASVSGEFGQYYDSEYVGGFVGLNYGTITNCYSTGSVIGMNNVGGFVGGAWGTITNCFWDKNTSGITTSGAATGKTTAEMTTLATFTEFGWDFKDGSGDGIWNIGNGRNNGYPYHDWNYPDDPEIEPETVAPTAQATNLIFSNQVNTVPDPDENDISINWTSSDDAESYLVVRNTASAPTFVPVDGTEYSVGAQTGGYVVYSGTANSATDANVSVNTHYYKIYTFNGSAYRTKYLTADPLSGNITVISGGQGTIDDTEGAPATVGFPEQGVTISFPDGTSGTTITSTKTNAAPSANFQGNAGVRGMSPLYFTITSSNATPGNYTIVLDFSSLGLTEAKWNQFKVMKRADADSYWKDITMDPHNGTIVSRQIDGVWGIFTISGLSSFSEFGGGDGEGVFTVTSNANAGENTLRGIIAAVDNGDLIEFDVAAMGSNTITLASTLVIDKDLTLVALGSDGGVILDGNNSVRVLDIGLGKEVILKNLIITRGYDAENVVAGIDNFGDLTLINCVVADNTAGGVSIADEGAIGGIYSTGDLTLINTTITNNTGAMTDFGIGGIYCTRILTMKNSILFGNFGESKNIASSIYINSYYSLFEESLTDLETDGNSFDVNEQNIFDSNPLFAGSIINPTHPYSILGISPAVDAGNNSYCLEEKDIRGFNRKQNSAIDIGAYEYTEDSDTLPVTLSSFTAIYTVSNTVSIMWTTQSESNMIGYHILRAETDELNNAIRMTTNIITAQNQPETQEYSFTDSEVEIDTEYFYWLQSAELDGTMEFFGPITVKTGKIGNEAPVIPLVTQLNGAYPNPFNPSTTISFDIAEKVKVTIDIFNIKGQKVKSLVNQEIAPGRHSIIWSGLDDNHRRVATGVYFYKMQAGKYSKIDKVLMMK